MAEYSVGGSLTLTRSYTWGLDLSGSQSGAGGVGGLLAIYDAASATSYGTAYDGNGNVTALIKRSGSSADAAGTVAAAYEYSGFGETIRATGEYRDLNPFRFSTKYTDNETGLVYYGMRYYDPANGRFLGRDPSQEKGGRNLYRFCGNNGVGRSDYLGMWPDWGDIGRFLGGWIAPTLQDLTAALSGLFGGSWNDDDTKDLVKMAPFEVYANDPATFDPDDTGEDLEPDTSWHADDRDDDEGKNSTEAGDEGDSSYGGSGGSVGSGGTAVVNNPATENPGVSTASTNTVASVAPSATTSTTSAATPGPNTGTAPTPGPVNQTVTDAPVVPNSVSFAVAAFIPGSLGRPIPGQNGTWVDEPGTWRGDVATDNRGFGSFYVLGSTSRVSTTGSIPVALIGNLGAFSQSGGLAQALGLKSVSGESHLYTSSGVRTATAFPSQVASAFDTGPNSSTILISVSAGYPLLPSIFTPNIDYTLRLDVSRDPANGSVAIGGQFEANRFPAYEVYINRSPVVSLPAIGKGPGIINLNTSRTESLP